MNVTILGLGKSGYAAAKYLKQQGADVLVSEKGQFKDDQLAWAEELKSLGVEIETGDHSQKAIEQADLIVTSPGIPPNSPVMQMAQQFGKEVICDIELAYRETSVPIIAVTGTNGKSTTTSLISHILEFNGMKAPACGNIGSPVMDYICVDRRANDKTAIPEEPVGAKFMSPFEATKSDGSAASPNYLVIEVSSYQLYYTNTFSPFIAIWLNLTPDHLDWHGSMEEYIAAKDKVFGEKTIAILNMDDPIVAARINRCAPDKSAISEGPVGAKFMSPCFPFSLLSDLKSNDPAAFLLDGWLCYRQHGKVHRVIAENEMPIIGKHNIENALAAIAATAITGLSANQIGNAIKKFKALAHRLEYVGTIDGIACYNDSKATNPESSIKALQAFKEKIVLIAGGKDKGTDLAEFSAEVKNHTAAVILIGEAKERFEKAFKKAGVDNIHIADSLADAVDLGLKLKLGPLVLSPACASYDMFKNFEQRGDIFKDLIRARCSLVK